ncbi:putative sporulation protein YtxC [Pullulanibacillus camelliae]|nr:putative sporulation protein YtxC [Pullulanibacillus camelliae]
MTMNSSHEAVSLYRFLYSRFANTIGIKRQHEEIELRFTEGLSEHLKSELIDSMTQYMIDFYEERWILHMIQESFYFTDESDQHDILDIVKAIFDGEKSELPKVDRLPSRQQIMRKVIEEVLVDHSSFSFKSLETFRLNDYFECLMETIELAIDEFKLQQEYAVFVDKLRKIVKTYKPLHHTVYAVDNDKAGYLLYDSNYQVVEAPPTVRSFYPLLKQWGVETQPSLLLTLIGLAPVTINVFTNREDHGMMHTLRKVFEESVHFYSLKEAEKLGLLFTG